MGLTRRSMFGFPPRPGQPSTQTVRMLPLTTQHRDQVWPAQPPGSAQSSENALPLDNRIVSRSRLSSMNTLATLGPVSLVGMSPIYRADGNNPLLWVSSGTLHGLVSSNGSISLASLVSAFGLDSAPNTNYRWQYAQVFSSVIDENMLVAAGPSYNTILALYQATNAQTAAPRYSYLTSAPRARALGVFDNYIVAFNILDTAVSSTVPFATRVQWCQRGSPSNWTGEGSGYEDLLAMRGYGTAIIGSTDNRILLFTSTEIWYGLTAPYPSQFQFFPLDGSVGCLAALTIAQTPRGFVFLGSDNQLRLLPLGGGISTPISPSLNYYLRREVDPGITSDSWAVYDSFTGLYYLTVDSADGGRKVVVVNIDTGEWGPLAYETTIAPTTGVALQHMARYTGAEGVFYGGSTGTVFSTSSLLLNDMAAAGSGSTVTMTWRSGVIGADLPSNYKLLTDVQLDYRTSSPSTVTLKISTNAGNTYETTGRALSLASTAFGNRVGAQVYTGGAFPALQLTSTSTGIDLHRIDVTLELGGRR